MRDKVAIIIGTGPAGLSAAYSLLKYTNNIKPIIIGENPTVGGLSRTLFKDGNGTDIGPHRFFTKNDEVFKFWTEFLDIQELPAADDKLLNRFKIQPNSIIDPESSDNVFLKRKRFSRIYYKKHFIDYPIKLNLNTFVSLGLKKTTQAGFSYLKSCVYKLKETNLETFMINRFGNVLYQLFFKNYTEKIWGLSPKLISEDWGEQRIKEISLMKVILDAFSSLFKLHNINKETSLIDEYYYPKLGSSQLWNLIAQKICDLGGEIILNSKVVKINFNEDKNSINSVEICNNELEQNKVLYGDFFISSMPIKDLISEIEDVPSEIKNISQNLQYRDFILVNFVCKRLLLKNNTNYPTIDNIAPDSWIYLQDDCIKAGRLDIMNSFSPYIVKDFQKDFVINLEYFCNENDDFWNKSDDEIIQFALTELNLLNIVSASDIKNKICYRIKKAYPSYFGAYNSFDKIKTYINSIQNLYCIGRNGQHKYNNMDHSILSGITAAKIIAYNLDKYSLWDINTEKSYQEYK